MNKYVSLQDICILLEQYKRQLGRQHSNTYKMENLTYAKNIRSKYRSRYNDVEHAIRYLVSEHDCVRTSKPYFLTDTGRKKTA